MRFFFGLLTLAIAQLAPVTFNNAEDTPPACKVIQCTPVECFPPFKWVNGRDSDSCCPLCVKEPTVNGTATGFLEMPYFASTLHPNAPTSCIGATCPALNCASDNQVYMEGDCCSQCA